MPQFLCLWFDGIGSPAILPDDASLLAALHRCVKGWDFHVDALGAAEAPPSPPFCVLEPRPNGRFRAHSRYLDAPLDGLSGASALCAILADLSQAHADQRHTHVFGLHSGGVTIGHRTVILAGERRAGKSTLVARLACEDNITILGDDVLPISEDRTITALGLAPRLRLPLPERASFRFRSHVENHLGPADERYGYLVTPALARHGHAARAEAFILLDRRPTGRATLHDLPADELLQAIVARSIAGPDGPESVFEAAQTMAYGLTGLRLVYSDLEDAVALLLAAFSRNRESSDGSVRVAPPVTGIDRPETLPCPPLSPDALIRRCTGIAVRRVEAAAFLWRPGDARLWHLNPTAHAIWSILESPSSARDIASLLGQAFPDHDPQHLLNDTCLLLSHLVAEGFVVPVRDV